MTDLWLIFRETINGVLRGPISFNIKRKIDYTNEKFTELGLKINFKSSDNQPYIIICNINERSEEDKKIISDIKIFNKFILKVYFDKDSVFGYDPQAFKGNEGIRLLNNLFEEHYLPYVVRMDKEYNVSLYNLGSYIH